MCPRGAKDRRMDDDRAEIDETARQYLRAHGRAAVELLVELAEIDAAAGDELSACTWRDIAEAAKRILGS